jgi:uncharacterized coiled-coil protein SlyX
MRWFRNGSEASKIQSLEARISALEGRMASAADLLEATERMDRVIKRSFRLTEQISKLEEKNERPVSNSLTNSTGQLTRADILRMKPQGA